MSVVSGSVDAILSKLVSILPIFYLYWYETISRKYLIPQFLNFI